MLFYQALRSARQNCIPSSQMHSLEPDASRRAGRNLQDALTSQSLTSPCGRCILMDVLVPERCREAEGMQAGCIFMDVLVLERCRGAEKMQTGCIFIVVLVPERFREAEERSISLSELYLSSSETADRMHRSCIPLSRMYLFTFEIADRMHRSCIPFSRPYLAAFKKTCRMQVLKLVHAGAGFHASSRTPAGFQDASGAAQKGSGTAERGPHPYQQRTSWPSSVTRTWISHWAEGLPSAV